MNSVNQKKRKSPRQKKVRAGAHIRRDGPLVPMGNEGIYTGSNDLWTTYHVLQIHTSGR